MYIAQCAKTILCTENVFTVLAVFAVLVALAADG